jgi:hypothetical protein
MINPFLLYALFLRVSPLIELTDVRYISYLKFLYG